MICTIPIARRVAMMTLSSMSTTTRKRSSKPARPKRPKLETYSDPRVAEFILSNTVDAADYARALKLVRKMGLDPEKIDHDKPIGVH